MSNSVGVHFFVNATVDTPYYTLKILTNIPTVTAPVSYMYRSFFKDEGLFTQAQIMEHAKRVTQEGFEAQTEEGIAWYVSPYSVMAVAVIPTPVDVREAYYATAPVKTVPAE